MSDSGPCDLKPRAYSALLIENSEMEWRVPALTYIRTVGKQLFPDLQLCIRHQFVTIPVPAKSGISWMCSSSNCKVSPIMAAVEFFRQPQSSEVVSHWDEAHPCGFSEEIQLGSLQLFRFVQQWTKLAKSCVLEVSGRPVKDQWSCEGAMGPLVCTKRVCFDRKPRLG